MDIAILIVVFVACLFAVRLAFELIDSYRKEYRMDFTSTARELNRFFVNVAPSRIVLIAAIMGGGLGYLAGSWVLAIGLALSGIFAPKIVLSIWKGIRSQQFDAQLMDALILLGNALKNGLDIVAGIELISTNMKPPISEEFGLVLNAYRLGKPLDEGLIDLTKRIDSRTLETIIYAINIQRDAGGNLVKTFDQLITTIREESKLQKKVSAMTSQGRTQVYFLAAFPWVLAVVFYVMAPEMMRPALENSYGQIAILVIIVWEIIGILVTKKIVTVEV